MAMRGKSAIILYGPPGSGKGTQAELLEKNLNFIHFDTGSQLRGILYDPKNKNNKEIQKERNRNEKGDLNTPAWVLKIVKQKTKKLSLLNQPIVFSGSPRTFFEAFGGLKNEGFFSFLSRKFGKKNVFIFVLRIPEEASIFRNSNRVYCSNCGGTLLAKYKNLKTCPFCDGKITKRKDDNKKIIEERLREYRERTQPIFNKIKSQKYNVVEIDGTPPPYKIHQKIVSYL